ncbi:MAG: hypothetical protein HKP61_10415 [Dactylosporangium sp.]|nr:hypothetical protein [Dactylosporangium sp.]NNJ61342.1 hypothetical protein [Dactylosporangium sp.]
MMRRPLVVGAAGGVILLGGWFWLSMLIAHSDPRSAARETIGFGLALLVLLSMVGAIRNGSRQQRRDR